MRATFLTRPLLLALLISGASCARNSDTNNTNDTGAAARDTATSDSVSGNQTESGVTDSSGQSTLPGAEQTRPDEGQPVTSKGDTIKSGMDSTARMDTTATGMDSSATGMDSTMTGMDSTTIRQ